jgi:hypothetical protein
MMVFVTAAAAAAAAMQEAISQHIQAFRGQTPLENTPYNSSSSSRHNSSSSPSVLLLKGQLEQHARHVVDIVQYRAAALQREAAAAAASSPPDTTSITYSTTTWKAPSSGRLQQGVNNSETRPANSHAAMLQQAQAQRSQRVAADNQALVEAAHKAVQLMVQQVLQLEAQGWPNAYLAGKLVEVRAGGKVTQQQGDSATTNATWQDPHWLNVLCCKERLHHWH